MSRFVFPTESFYGARFNPKINYASGIKLIRASGALLTIEILESAGYELEWSDALTVMKFFAKHRLFEENLEKRWYDDVMVANEAKNEMTFPNLSLYDLNRMRPEEAETLLIFDLGYTRKLWELPNRYTIKRGLMHEMEILLRVGVDPNSANDQKSTPLHLICTDDVSLIKHFLDTCKNIKTPVQVNAQDCKGKTPTASSTSRR
ncbi:unnamed protein product [Trichogramma brassicae]|uniref:Uncharacterized protein n=1 Tax=Trichogramma brassicae TaxID=86971 RepID=A0A6H5J5B9_9HYME|nr:unnamed protein product [Trichogramma brassicae]